MSAQVQQLVDELAEVLQRSVAVDDPDIQLIAASPHIGAIDSTRMDVILSRKTQPRIVQFARGLHLEHARGPRRIAGSPELDILPRVVFPVRDHDELYGYLWLIDVSPPVTKAEVEVTAATVEAIAKALASETRAEDSRHAEDAELVSALLSEDPDRRREATARAERAGRLRTDRPWRVAAVRLAAEQSGGDQSNLAHASAVMRGVLSRPLSAMGDDEFVVISDDDGWDPVPRGKRPPVRPAWERLRSVLDSRGLTLGSVGVSPRLEDEPLHFARRRAHYCAHVASTIPSYGGVAHWEQLGAWQLLYGLPWTPETVRTLHPGIEVLLRPPHRELAVTLATYLDRGGDTGGTIEALRVHRATLYYRRDRIRALIGTDWESGWGRVGAHAALMLAGLLDPGVAAVPRPGAGEAVQADVADFPTRWTASRPR